MPYELPALPYAYDALEPYLDAQTVEIHHDKHHATYCANLNKAVAGTDLENADIWEVLSGLNTVPEGIRTAVRNQGGGYANHNLFWECMGPGGGGSPAGELLNGINESFGSFDAFKEKFNNLAISQFGSGWAWLGVASDGRLCACSTPNQDNPAMKGIVECTATPILTLDVWEHAYYLKYHNRRAEWVQNWWNLVNWEVVSQKYLLARK